MKAMAVQNAAFRGAEREQVSLLSRLVKTCKEAFLENKATIICGVVSMSTNEYVFPMYRDLSK